MAAPVSLCSRRGIMTWWLIVVWRHTWRHLVGMAVTSPRQQHSYLHLHHPGYFYRRNWPLTWLRGQARSRQGHVVWRHRSRVTVRTVGELICWVWLIVATSTAVTCRAVAKSTTKRRTSRLTYGTSASDAPPSFPREAFPRDDAQWYVSVRCDSRVETYHCALLRGNASRGKDRRVIGPYTTKPFLLLYFRCLVLF